MGYVTLLFSLSLLGSTSGKPVTWQDACSFTQTPPSQTVELHGIILSDRLHASFRLPHCADRIVPVLYELTANKNASLRIYQERVRSSRTGFVEYPIILIGRFDVTEGDGLVFRAIDFREPD